MMYLLVVKHHRSLSKESPIFSLKPWFIFSILKSCDFVVLRGGPAFGARDERVQPVSQVLNVSVHAKERRAVDVRVAVTKS